MPDKPVFIERDSNRIDAEGVKGFSECWYPVALADDVPVGGLLGVAFLDGRVVVYRGDDGVARVQSAYCRHLGADLSVGEVTGNDIRCAFHHWQYGPDGRCSVIPASPDSIPAEAQLFAYPTAEKWGLIWAFNGTEPSYDVPSFAGREVEELGYSAIECEPYQVDPFVLLTNSMDFQHLVAMHGMELEGTPEDIEMGGNTFEYVAEGEMPNFGPLHQQIRVFGSNCIALTMTQGEDIELLAMFAGTPVAGRTRGFQVSAAVRGDGSEDDQERVQQVIDLGHALGLQLQDEDAPVMNTIRFRQDVLIEADHNLAKFLSYVRAYPRSHPGDGLIN